MSSSIYGIGSRLMSNVLQSQCAKTFTIQKNEAKSLVQIESGEANFPDLNFKCNKKPNWEMEKEFNQVFDPSTELLRAICYQDYAITELPVTGSVCKGKINLQLDESKITPLQLTELVGKEFNELAKDCAFFGFQIPEVKFTSIEDNIVSASIEEPL